MQTGVDSLGNIEVDPSQPEPERADVLYGGFGNDVLNGSAGRHVPIDKACDKMKWRRAA